MEQIVQIIREICPTIGELEGVKLVTDKIIDSVELVQIISDLEEAFQVEIDMEDIVPENFDTVEAIWKLIQQL